MSHNLNILVVEDDFIIATDLQFSLRSMGYNVDEVFPSAKEAIAYVKKIPVDFAIFDINLKGDIDGIELAGLISKHFHIPFVFLTTLVDKEFVNRAKKVKPYAYMLKPFNKRQLGIAIEMAITNYSEGNEAQIPTSQNEDESKDEEKQDNIFNPVKGAFFLRKNNKYHKVKFEEIYFIEADGNYTIIHTTSGDYIYSFVLRKIEDKLTSEDFMKVHRSYLINVNHVSGMAGNMINISDSEIPVSRNYREDLNKRFDFIK